MDLENNIWINLNGGYKIPFNASIALKKLKENDIDLLDDSFNELWDNLHHQGDVGVVSYFLFRNLQMYVQEKNLLIGILLDYVS